MNQQSTYNNLIAQFPAFIDRVADAADKLDLDVSFLDIDHIGLRFRNDNDVTNVRDELVNMGCTVLSNEVVNGRMILIIKLKEPLEYGQFVIPCIELPYPAATHTYPSDGWEHVEFVLTSTATTLESFEQQFIAEYPDFDRKQSGITYKPNMPVVENSMQLPNPTVSIKIEEMLTIKFHPASIERVVRKESDV